MFYYGVMFICHLFFQVACTLGSSFTLISGFSDKPPGPKNETTADAHTTSGNGSGSEILVIFIVIIVFGLLVFFLFKVWQKKKREDQYARLLKLFEEDDELELELGLRD